MENFHLSLLNFHQKSENFLFEIQRKFAKLYLQFDYAFKFHQMEKYAFQIKPFRIVPILIKLLGVYCKI